MQLRFSLTIFLCALCFGCTPSQPQKPPVEAGPSRAEILYDKIKIGDSRATVENILGKPFMMQKNREGDMAMYMLGMEGMMEAMRGQMAMAQGASSAQSLLGMAGSLGAFAGPAGGIAGSIGSEIIGTGTSLAMAAGQPSMPDPSQMQMLMITYEDGVVTSVQRMNPDQMGAGGMSGQGM